MLHFGIKSHFVHVIIDGMVPITLHAAPDGSGVEAVIETRIDSDGSAGVGSDGDGVNISDVSCLMLCYAVMLYHNIT